VYTDRGEARCAEDSEELPGVWRFLYEKIKELSRRLFARFFLFFPRDIHNEFY
jgi:hypothetical protein